MRSKGLVPQIVLVSTARRTMETLERLQPWDEPPAVDANDALYLAPASRMLELLRDLKETIRTVLLIGHNPGLQELAMWLAGPHAKSGGRKRVRQLARSYPTGTLAEFTLDCPWSEISKGSGKLTRMITP